MHLGRLFFQEPTDACLRKVIFEPDTVREKGWVVFINYMLLGMVSMEPGRSNEADRLRVNVHSALNDSGIFLSPSIVNIQTLATLAIHGEDFASPTQSWMLVGHACRQAEALSLHHSASGDSDREQQRLCLFWLLFLIDKSCALAFGRLPILRSSTCRNTSYPQYQYLARNCPQIGEANNGSAQVRGSDFGARFYTRGFELAKLIGTVLETAAEGEEGFGKLPLRAQIDEWHKSAHTVRLPVRSPARTYNGLLTALQELHAAMSAEAIYTTAAQQREMALGIQSFKFQYLHLLIVLLRGDVAHAALRIASAREALSMLPEMISNWGSVYNGVVWCVFKMSRLTFGMMTDGMTLSGNCCTFHSAPSSWYSATFCQIPRRGLRDEIFSCFR